MKKLTQHGIGLVVIILMILAMGLTASIVSISVKFVLDEQNQAYTVQRLKLLQLAISSTNYSGPVPSQRSYEQDVGSLPSTLNDLLTKPVSASTCGVSTSTQVISGWCGPYVIQKFTNENSFADGWGTTIVYSTSPRQLKSYGSNGVDNSGSGDDIVQTY